MQGLRTLIVGLLMAISPVALTYLGGVDWTQVLPPGLVWAAPIFSGAVMIVMRLISTGPVRFLDK